MSAELAKAQNGRAGKGTVQKPTFHKTFRKNSPVKFATFTQIFIYKNFIFMIYFKCLLGTGVFSDIKK